MAESYRWKPISTEGWKGSFKPSGLVEVWRDFKPLLDSAALEQIRIETAREWAIETGLIEKAFELDRGVTVQLIEHGFSSARIPFQSSGMSKEQVALILEDAEQALEFLFDRIKSKEPLTSSFIKELHQLLLRNIHERDVVVETPHGRVWEKRQLRKGEWKRQPNSPHTKDGSIHEYCPPLEVDAEIDRFISLHEELRNDGEPPELIASWLHHAFTQIHPFEDGNGRVARALASLELLRAGLPPLTVPVEMENRYLETLLLADYGKPEELLSLMQSCLYRQTVRFWHALAVSSLPALSEGASMEEILTHARRKLEKHHGLLPREWESANRWMESLFERSGSLMQPFANQIHGIVNPTHPEYKAGLGHTAFEPAYLSVSKCEGWGDGFSQAQVFAKVIEVFANRTDQVLLLADRFHSKRSGLAAIALVLKTDVEKQLMPSFFLNFHSGHNVVEFDNWLTEGLRRAALEWAKMI